MLLIVSYKCVTGLDMFESSVNKKKPIQLIGEQLVHSDSDRGRCSRHVHSSCWSGCGSSRDSRRSTVGHLKTSVRVICGNTATDLLYRQTYWLHTVSSSSISIASIAWHYRATGKWRKPTSRVRRIWSSNWWHTERLNPLSANIDRVYSDK